jgi:hypothetical protein
MSLYESPEACRLFHAMFTSVLFCASFAYIRVPQKYRLKNVQLSSKQFNSSNEKAKERWYLIVTVKIPGCLSPNAANGPNDTYASKMQVLINHKTPCRALKMDTFSS